MAPEPLDMSAHELLFKATDLSKLANIDLSQYLEAYMKYIRNLFSSSSAVKEMNFAEAAMVIQNSSIIFAKNVDAIWARAMNIRLALSANMNRKKSEDDDDDCEGVGENGADKSEKPGKKKKRKTFNVDEFKLLDFIHTDKNIDLKLDKKEDKPTKKLDKLVLPTNLRVKSKVNKSRDIFTSEGEPVGKMDEFRLFWPITKSGCLQEDYEQDDKCVFPERIFEQSFAEVNENPVNEEIFNNDVDNTILDGHGPYSPPPPTPPPTPPPADLPMNDSPESLKDNAEEERGAGQRVNKNVDRENIVSVEKIVEKAWEPISIEGGVPSKPLLKRKVFKLDPSDPQRKRKNKGKLDTEAETLIVSEMFTMGKYNLTKGHGFDTWTLAEFHTEQMKKVKESLQRRKKILDMLDAGSEYEGDFYGFDDTEINGEADFDPDDGDNDFGGGDGVENIDVPLPANANNAGTIFDDIGPSNIWNGNAEEPIDSGDQYEAHALRTIQQYNANKSLDESRANDLALRVAAWHEMIAPVLKEAENRSHFDIHEYGSRILNNFPDNNSRTTISFEKIARNEPPEEVARYFLSSLVLANTYNVELSKSCDEDLAVNCLQLTILSKVRHQDEIDDNMRSNNQKS